MLRANGIKSYKVQKYANRDDIQAKRAKIRARRLYNQFLCGKNVCIIKTMKHILLEIANSFLDSHFIKQSFVLVYRKNSNTSVYLNFPKSIRYGVPSAVVVVGVKTLFLKAR